MNKTNKPNSIRNWIGLGLLMLVLAVSGYTFVANREPDYERELHEFIQLTRAGVVDSTFDRTTEHLNFTNPPLRLEKVYLDGSRTYRVLWNPLDTTDFLRVEMDKHARNIGVLLY